MTDFAKSAQQITKRHLVLGYHTILTILYGTIHTFVWVIVEAFCFWRNNFPMHKSSCPASYTSTMIERRGMGSKEERMKASQKREILFFTAVFFIAVVPRSLISLLYHRIEGHRLDAHAMQSRQGWGLDVKEPKGSATTKKTSETKKGSAPKPPVPMIHIVKTDFLQYQPASLELLEARIEILKTFSLPSLLRQTEQNFFWIVSVEHDMPREILDQLAEVLKPHPNFYLVQILMDKRAQGGRDILRKTKPDDFLSGDTTRLFDVLDYLKKVPVLETRLEPDDALNVKYMKTIQAEAEQVFLDDRDGRDWMYWCVSKWMEWHWHGTKDSSSGLQQYGALAPNNGTESGMCDMTNAVTIGVKRGYLTKLIVWTSHPHLLQEQVTKPKTSCGGNYTGKDCLTLVDKLGYGAMRTHNPTYAAVENQHIATHDDSDADGVSQQWTDAYQMFGLEKDKAEAVNQRIAEIPQYYLYPPRADRFLDHNISETIKDIPVMQLLQVPSNRTYPKVYKKGEVFHIVKTRFMQYQPKLVELGKARLELFKTFCLPSMLHQTTQNFFWLIYTDPDLDDYLLQETIKLIKPYPHFYLVKSLVDKRGLGGRDILNRIDQKDFHVGDVTMLYANLNNVHWTPVLESRFDADDALNINYIEEIQKRSLQVFVNTSKKRDWMFWCINQALEWHWVGPGGREQLRKYGAIVPSRQYDNFCHTPGLTVGFKRGTFTRTVAKSPHHLLVQMLEEEQTPCGSIYKGTDCVEFIKNFDFCALRSRTPTSASMANVNSNGGKIYRLAAEEAVLRWRDVIKDFALLPANTEAVNDYFFMNMKPILEESLRGQCTEGHSCREEAKTAIEDLIEIFSKRGRAHQIE